MPGSQFSAAAIARIVLGARDRVVDDAGDAAVFVDRVRRLAPLDVVGRAQEGLHGLEQDRARTAVDALGTEVAGRTLAERTLGIGLLSAGSAESTGRKLSAGSLLPNRPGAAFQSFARF